MDWLGRLAPHQVHDPQELTDNGGDSTIWGTIGAIPGVVTRRPVVDR